MKHTALLLFLLAIPLTAHAQTITLGTITKTSYCMGDMMFVPYTATGTFNPGNYFFAELSDANGSFGSFTPFGNSTLLNGSIPIPMTAAGNSFRVRVASSDPYDTSTNNGDNLLVVTNPYADPWATRKSKTEEYPTDYTTTYTIGMVSDTIIFLDPSPSGSTHSWRFDQDAVPSTATAERPNVTYAHDGIKTGSLTVTSPSGCNASSGIKLYIVGCSPVIPRDVHVITTVETNDYASVWVKPGGSYQPSSAGARFVFVEAGASVTVAGVGWGEDIYYVKPGASVTLPSSGANRSVILLERGMNISYNPSPINVDTLYCDNLTFDYSQVSGGVAEEAQPAAPRISQSGEQLFVTAEDAPLSVRMVNVLGNEIASMDGRGTVELDLSPLPAGIYFAIAQAGSQRVVRKIAVH